MIYDKDDEVKLTLDSSCNKEYSELIDLQRKATKCGVVISMNMSNDYNSTITLFGPFKNISKAVKMIYGDISNEIYETVGSDEEAAKILCQIYNVPFEEIAEDYK